MLKLLKTDQDIQLITLSVITLSKGNCTITFWSYKYNLIFRLQVQFRLQVPLHFRLQLQKIYKYILGFKCILKLQLQVQFEVTITNIFWVTSTFLCCKFRYILKLQVQIHFRLQVHSYVLSSGTFWSYNYTFKFRLHLQV